jgi:serine protease Do
LKHSHALAAKVADSNGISVMDEVFAVGNPEGLGLSVTGGNISVEHDYLSVLAADGKTTLKLRVIRTSAAINEGNSGGGLYNAEGELCGIVVAKKTGDDIDNIAYAIPSNLATLISDILIESYTGSVTVGFTKYHLGITMKSAAMTVKVNEEGELVREELVSISEIKEGSVLSGKAELGDIITSISVGGTDIPVTRIHNVTEAMLKARLGNTVTLTLLRGDKTFTVTLTVSEAMETVVV